MFPDISKINDLNIYDDLINGHLRPFLPENSKLCNIKNLVKEANTRTILKAIDKSNVNKLLDEMDLTIYGYRSINDINIDIVPASNGKIADVVIKPRKIYNFKDYIDIPPAPDQKSAQFLSLISDEFERIKIRSKKVLESTDCERKLSLYANKHIIKAKQIAYDARFLFSEIQNKGQFINDNPDVYILFVFNLFLIRLIIYYRKFFKPFVAPSSETEQNLRMEFFYSLPVHIKYPYLFNKFSSPSGSSFIANENDNTVYFPKSSLPQSSDSNSLDTVNKTANQNLSNSSFKKIPWNRGTNVLVDVLLSLSAKFQLKGQSPMTATNEQIQSLIINNFVDKNGNNFSEETINSYLKPAHSDKLPKDKSPKKIDLSGFFTKESDS